MAGDFSLAKARFDRLRGEKDLVERTLLEKKGQVEEKKHRVEVLTKARWVLSEVARLTQERFKDRVEALVTTAIRAVFDRPFEFVLELERKRNKLECQLLVKEGQIEYVPKDDMGGGIVDVISFALRVVLWSMQKPRTRNVLILDEPMKYVGKGELLERAGRMLREISQGLGVQLIVVTHEPQLMEKADRAYYVRHNGKESMVEQVEGGEGEKQEKKSRRLRRRRA